MVWALVLVLGCLIVPGARAQQSPVSIIAAEAVYADIAGQIAGPWGSVSSIRNSPDQDPHLFEASPSVARAIAGSRIVIMNGADYDPWMRRLLNASPRSDRKEIDVGALMQVKPGANPHLWYDPRAIPAYARAVADVLSAVDPPHRLEYQKRLMAFLSSLDAINAKVEQTRGSFADTSVTATEPVFGYMAEAIGLSMRNQRFQLAIMNDTEPGARETATFEHDLRNRSVRVLLYNSQAANNLTRRMRQLAEQSGIPVVGVAETEPPGKTYQQWMLDCLTALDAALSKPRS
jgi:zinc/manganese transport system substrate-binding protein